MDDVEHDAGGGRATSDEISADQCPCRKGDLFARCPGTWDDIVMPVINRPFQCQYLIGVQNSAISTAGIQNDNGY